ncbi:MAG: glutamate--tRNA ligase [Candidatus Hydrogenedentota bacterium]|nr:MAG: glutamate--tRNA ligase [Candidatus Hydrogenedentota bacterium]
MSDVRVRIAPSPSGFLHIGTAKIALMNWLYARQQGGAFVLRLEDTDAERTEEEFVQAMCDGFKWLGINWDEGPPFGDEPEKGELGPYRQSQRVELHRAKGQQLLDDEKAYKCFCTKEELDIERERAQAEKRPPRYNGKCRNLTPDEVAAKEGQRCVVRFKVPEGTTVIEDLVQGRVETNNVEFDDFVILKPTGDPIFHLAVVVDDGEMKISHVMRGDDHLTNTNRHIMLFEALGYSVPKFAHLPMVLDERGKKYSKRIHGANVLDWRDDGYLPETMLNYVALMGWSPGDDSEIFTKEELLKAFSVERLGKSAAKFDLKRLQWINGQHMRKLAIPDLRDRLLPIMNKAGLDTNTKSDEWLSRMTEICQEKIRTLNEIVDYTDFFFSDPSDYEEKGVRKQWKKEGAKEKMNDILQAFQQADPWSHESLHDAIEALAQKNEVGLGQYIHPTRLALTGKSIGPGLFELADLLGQEDCISRIEIAIEYIQGLGN